MCVHLALSFRGFAIIALDDDGAQSRTMAAVFDLIMRPEKPKVWPGIACPIV